MEDLQQSLLPLLISSQTHHIGFAKLKSRNPRNPTQSTGGGGINGVNREQDLERSVLGDQELLLLALWDKLRDLGVKLEVVKAEASAESGEGGGEGQRIGGLSGMYLLSMYPLVFYYVGGGLGDGGGALGWAIWGMCANENRKRAPAATYRSNREPEVERDDD